MMKRTILAATTLLCLLGVPQAHAGSECPNTEVRNIQTQFDERLSYEARRAQRRKMPTTDMVNGFKDLDRSGSCHAVFERHQAYLDRWADRIDQRS